MTMASDWLGPAERDDCETADPDGSATASDATAPKSTPSLLTPLDPALQKLLERGDDRLLRDIGLSRESPFAEVAKFWSEWSRWRGPWGV